MGQKPIEGSNPSLSAKFLVSEHSLAGVIFAFDMSGELVAMEIHVTQRPARIARGLVVEVGRIGVAALAAGRDRFRAYALAELDGGDEAVAARAVVLLRVTEGPIAVAEGGER